MGRKVKSIQRKAYSLPPTYIYQVLPDEIRKKLLDLKKELDVIKKERQTGGVL